MPANLSWNEIQARAMEFQSRWAGEASEDAEAKTFWNEFFAIFGVDHLATLPEGFPRPRLVTDLDRVAFLFRLYEYYVGRLAPVTEARKPARFRGKRAK